MAGFVKHRQARQQQGQERGKKESEQTSERWALACFTVALLTIFGGWLVAWFVLRG